MKEIITDELVEHLVVTYQNHVKFSESVGAVPYTFEKFAETQLRTREIKIRKALDEIGKEKEEAK